MQIKNKQLAPRTAFTMVELVIVIAIIAILMAFLLPAIGGAITSARNATVVSEISNLEKAIGEFKLKFGVEPPSRIYLYEQEAGWDRTDLITRESKAFIRQCWPNFDFDYTDQSGELDINGNDAIESTDDGRIFLNGAECLLFFLGGMCATEDSTGAALRDASGSTPPSGTAGTIE
ncbi:prepilin-type N-terminal cleavage/methylation domain-containing protein, partial [bacterium]|nr:prepilin-type N-terminal cleavage/methylation domain-containing protein [bacterium]